MKYLSLLFSFSTLLCWSSMQGQVAAPADYVLRLTFTEKQKSFFIVDSLDGLNMLDMVKLKEYEQERVVSKYLIDTGDVVTIIDHLNSVNYFEEWMPEVKTTYIDGSGVYLFDSIGEQLMFLPHSPRYDTLSLLRAANFFPAFEPLAAAQIAELESNGVVVDSIGGAALSIRFGNKETLYDHSELRIENRVYDGEGLPSFVASKRFITLTGGEIVPERVVEKRAYTFSSGVCGHFVTIKAFGNYELEYADTTIQRKYGYDLPDRNLNFTLVNNPVYEKLTITVPEKATGANIQLRIIDFTGNVQSAWEGRTEEVLEVRVGALPAGIYIVSIYAEGKSWNSKFVKI